MSLFLGGVSSRGVLDLGLRHDGLNVQQDELVGDDAELLQRHCLHARAWEALDDPVLVLLLELQALLLYQVNHDVVVN